jgi:hypothetical protein
MMMNQSWLDDAAGSSSQSDFFKSLSCTFLSLYCWLFLRLLQSNP